MKNPASRRRIAAMAMGAALIAAGHTAATPKAMAQSGHAPVRISNVATKVGNGQWRWTVYVAGPASEIGNIGCVVYRLHPTFPNPVQRVCGTSDPKYPFGLTATGWGTFGLLAQVEFRDGQSQDVVWVLDFNLPPLP